MRACFAWFVFGFGAVALAFVGVFDLVRTLATTEDSIDPSRFLPVHFTVLALEWSALPVLGALAGALLVDAARPRRVFTPGSTKTISLLARGGAAGAVWIVALMIALPAINEAVPDAVVLAGSAPLATALVLLLTCRRERPGRCTGCGYDLRGSRQSGKCPECGRSCKPDYATMVGA